MLGNLVQLEPAAFALFAVVCCVLFEKKEDASETKLITTNAPIVKAVIISPLWEFLRKISIS
jgi:hypothetical protein